MAVDWISPQEPGKRTRQSVSSVVTEPTDDAAPPFGAIMIAMLHRDEAPRAQSGTPMVTESETDRPAAVPSASAERTEAMATVSAGGSQGATAEPGVQASIVKHAPVTSGSQASRELESGSEATPDIGSAGAKAAGHAPNPSMRSTIPDLSSGPPPTEKTTAAAPIPPSPSLGRTQAAATASVTSPPSAVPATEALLASTLASVTETPSSFEVTRLLGMNPGAPVSGPEPADSGPVPPVPPHPAAAATPANPISLNTSPAPHAPAATPRATEPSMVTPTALAAPAVTTPPATPEVVPPDSEFASRAVDSQPADVSPAASAAATPTAPDDASPSADRSAEEGAPDTTSANLVPPLQENDGAALPRQQTAHHQTTPTLFGATSHTAPSRPPNGAVPMIELLTELTRRANLRVLSQGRQVRLQLEPHDLGRLRMALENDADGRIVAHVQVETEAARVAVESRLGALGAALSANGFSLADLQVSVGQRESDPASDFTPETSNTDSETEERAPLLTDRPPTTVARGRLDIVV